MSAGPKPRTTAANAARRAATQAKVQRVRDAIAQLRRHKQPITYPAVALKARARGVRLRAGEWRAGAQAGQHELQGGRGGLRRKAAKLRDLWSCQGRSADGAGVARGRDLW